LRLFFNRYPSVAPPSYNNSPSLMPINVSAMDVISITRAAVMQDYASLIIKSVTVAFKILSGIAKRLNNERQGVSLPGHYIEIDTNEPGEHL
jgi:hypothetical protein